MSANTRTNCNTWPETESATLRTCAEAKLTVPEIKENYLPHRTEAAIMKQGYDLGLSFTPRKTSRPGTPEPTYYRAKGVLKHSNGLDVHYY